MHLSLLFLFIRLFYLFLVYLFCSSKLYSQMIDFCSSFPPFFPSPPLPLPLPLHPSSSCFFIFLFFYSSSPFSVLILILLLFLLYVFFIFPLFSIDYLSFLEQDEERILRLGPGATKALQILRSHSNTPMSLAGRGDKRRGEDWGGRGGEKWRGEKRTITQKHLFCLYYITISNVTSR